MDISGKRTGAAGAEGECTRNDAEGSLNALAPIAAERRTVRGYVLNATGAYTGSASGIHKGNLLEARAHAWIPLGF